MPPPDPATQFGSVGLLEGLSVMVTVHPFGACKINSFNIVSAAFIAANSFSLEARRHCPSTTPHLLNDTIKRIGVIICASVSVFFFSVNKGWRGRPGYVECREQGEREASPAAAIIDSQSVKSAEKGVLYRSAWL